MGERIVNNVIIHSEEGVFGNPLPPFFNGGKSEKKPCKFKKQRGGGLQDKLPLIITVIMFAIGLASQFPHHKKGACYY